MWLQNERLQRLGGGFGERLAIGIVSKIHLIMMGAHKEKKTMRLIKQVRRERKSLLTAFESFILYSIVRAQRKRPGWMAEVGVFEGASAKLICEARAGKPLHLFDTFEGLPEVTDADRRVHRQKQYACSLESVRDYLKGYDDVHFHKGQFPDSEGLSDHATYSFAHFDVDLYDGTLECLKYFYPRMIPGGIMLSHDYSLLAGVKKAIEEFFKEKPEEVLEMPTSQCMVMKL